MDKKKTKNLFSWQLTPIRITCIVLIFFIGMCWSFILGIFVGRGYKPPFLEIENKKEIKQDENIIPSEELTFLDALRKKDNLKQDKSNSFPTTNSIEKEEDKFVYIYQCGSFKNKKDAESLKLKLEKLSLKYKHEIYLEEVNIKKEKWTRVMMKIISTKQENESIQDTLQKNNITFFIKKYSKL
ncbi:MAG: DedD protein [Desulfonauticus sp.]|jgi:cell division protein FtsN|nr:MAG: Sporulation domain protein [Desulfonauticus sp. 38_4375]MDK2921986.1 DedD protein [Desulfonauticus sp.]